jgi:RNA-directed DNA polymerase
MSLPSSFLNIANFTLAFQRIVRGGNNEYKQFYRHLFTSYDLALEENLRDVIDDIKRGTYEPQHPNVVYQPKKSGVLRPLAILSLRDLIVYQAIVNRIAAAFEKDQHKHGLKRSFGALFAGKSSQFFYRSWRTCYASYNKAVTASFKAGNTYVADFDLVSFYELIDHDLLRTCLGKRVRSDELLDLLFTCLREWTLGL